MQQSKPYEKILKNTKKNLDNWKENTIFAVYLIGDNNKQQK
jgi:hypothetical protein